MNATVSQIVNIVLAVLVLIILARIVWRRWRVGLPVEPSFDAVLRDRMYGLVFLALAGVGVLGSLGPLTTAVPELLEPVRFAAAALRALALVLLLGLVIRR
jgi:hypothetical protein